MLSGVQAQLISARFIWERLQGSQSKTIRPRPGDDAAKVGDQVSVLVVSAIRRGEDAAAHFRELVLKV